MLGLSAPALGGGFAVATLDRDPDRFEAGRTYSIGYTIRQHGVTPISVDRTEIRITGSDSGQRLAFPGVPEGPLGHYVAKVTIPAAGSWIWEITQDPFAPHQLGALRTTASGAAPAPAGVTPGGSATAGPDGLLLSSVLIALAGTAVFIGTHLANAAALDRPGRAA